MRWLALGAIGVSLLQPGNAVAQPVGVDATPTAPAVVPGTLSVHATAHRHVVNSIAEVSLGIELHGRDVAQTLTLLAGRSKDLIEYLRSENVDRLGSDQVNLTPETQERAGQPDRITGYTGRQTVTFRTDPAKVPRITGDALTHGANNLQQVGLMPRESDMETARNDLAIEATRQAINQIRAVAAAADQQVTSFAEIVVAPDARQPRPMLQAASMARVAAAPAIPIEAGDTDVTVRVEVKARILPRTAGQN